MTRMHTDALLLMRRYPELKATDAHVGQYYMFYIHVAIMIYVGFGFLMTFLRCRAGLNLPPTVRPRNVNTTDEQTCLRAFGRTVSYRPMMSMEILQGMAAVLRHGA